MRSIITALVAMALLSVPIGLSAQGDMSAEEAQEMIEGYKQKLKDCKDTVSGYEKEISDLEGELRDLDREIGALEREIADLKNLRASTYIVKKGDWLAKLAEYPEVYGHGNYAMWPKIYRANKDKIKDPNLIYPGQVLFIPR